MATNNFINRIREWPIEKKRTFSIVLAIFLTLLIIILNFSINFVWKDETKENILINSNSPINSLQQSFSKIWNEAQPAFNNIFSTSTKIVENSESNDSEENILANPDPVVLPK